MAATGTLLPWLMLAGLSAAIMVPIQYQPPSVYEQIPYHDFSYEMSATPYEYNHQVPYHHGSPIFSPAVHLPYGGGGGYMGGFGGGGRVESAVGRGGGSSGFEEGKSFNEDQGSLKGHQTKGLARNHGSAGQGFDARGKYKGSSRQEAFQGSGGIGHKKGHKAKGFRKSYHNEESGKDEEFVDEDHDEDEEGYGKGFGGRGWEKESEDWKGSLKGSNWEDEEARNWSGGSADGLHSDAKGYNEGSQGNGRYSSAASHKDFGHHMDHGHYSPYHHHYRPHHWP